MTKKERNYLRSIYHHMESRLSINPMETPSPEKLMSIIKNAQVLHKSVFHVLSLQGDIDGQSEIELEGILNQNGITILK